MAREGSRRPAADDARPFANRSTWAWSTAFAASSPGTSGGFRSFEDVAEYIHLSRSTLKGRLTAQGTSFSALVERERQKGGPSRLRSSCFSIEEIAERLDIRARIPPLDGHHARGLPPQAPVRCPLRLGPVSCRNDYWNITPTRPCDDG
jgi:hypothetical protein